MFTTAAPQAVGFSEESIQRFLAELRKREINFHSVLLAKGDSIFFEKY